MRTVVIAVQLDTCGGCPLCVEEAEQCFGLLSGVTNFAYDVDEKQVTLNAQKHVTDEMILRRFRYLGYSEAQIIA